MELISMSIIFSLVALFFSLPLLFFLTRKRNKSQLPPGKTGWPFIGETLSFHKSGLTGVPPRFVQDRMQMFSPRIFKTSLLGEKMAVLCGPDGNKFLFSNENKLVKVWYPSSVMKIFPPSPSVKHSSDEEIVRFRKTLASYVNADALQRYAGIIDSITKQHLKTHWENNKEVIAAHLIKKYTFSVVCKAFLGIDDPVHLEKLSGPFDLMAIGIKSLPINLPGTSLNKAIKASAAVRKDLLEHIKKRKVDLMVNKSSVPQDVLSHMLLTMHEHGEDEKAVSVKSFGLLFGSLDTVSAAITFVIKYLAELPHIYNEVLREQKEVLSSMTGEFLKWEDIQKMKYSWSVASEVIRLIPPVQGTFREAITDLTYAGFSVPKGWKLYWSLHSTHRDAKYFPDPDKFNPSRFEGNGPAPYTYVPFGSGPRMCPGREFTRVVIVTFMHNIITKFKWEKILPDEKVIVNPIPTPVKGLPLRLEKHNIGNYQ
ncbi:hypothetical protein AQUCO_01100593v1 [Aquilegia coerulea]|nr:hypothetical protein AQUCO_01100593v1 [Aquilegia coerulea]